MVSAHGVELFTYYMLLDIFLVIFHFSFISLMLDARYASMMLALRYARCC